METFRSKIEGLRHEERKLSSGEAVDTLNGSDVVAALFPEYGNSSARPFLDVMGVGVVMSPSSKLVTAGRIVPGSKEHDVVRRYIRGDIVRVAELMDLAVKHGGVVNVVEHLLEAERERNSLRKELAAAKEEMGPCKGKDECDMCRHRLAVSEIYQTSRWAFLGKEKECAQECRPSGETIHSPRTDSDCAPDSPCLFRMFCGMSEDDKDAMLRAASTLSKDRSKCLLSNSGVEFPTGEYIAVVVNAHMDKSAAGNKTMKLYMRVQRRPGDKMLSHIDNLPIEASPDLARDRAASIVCASMREPVEWSFDNFASLVLGRPFMATFYRKNGYVSVSNCKPFVRDNWKTAEQEAVSRNKNTLSETLFEQFKKELAKRADAVQ